jgi:hypothetical protein
MKLSQTVANDLRVQKPDQRSSTGLQHDLSPGGPKATRRNLGSVGLQAAHYRDLDTDEIRIGPLSQHFIVLFTKPPVEMTIGCEEVKRDSPPLVGSIALVPAGAVADVSWRGKKDTLDVYIEPDLVARIAARSFERDLSSAAIPPLDAIIVPEIRSAMLAIDAELETRAAGGPLVTESLANILAVNLIRHVLRTPPGVNSGGCGATAPKARHGYRLHHGKPRQQTDTGTNGRVGPSQP